MNFFKGLFAPKQYYLPNEVWVNVFKNIPEETQILKVCTLWNRLYANNLFPLLFENYRKYPQLSLHILEVHDRPPNERAKELVNRILRVAKEFKIPYEPFIKLRQSYGVYSPKLLVPLVSQFEYSKKSNTLLSFCKQVNPILGDTKEKEFDKLLESCHKSPNELQVFCSLWLTQHAYLFSNRLAIKLDKLAFLPAELGYFKELTSLHAYRCTFTSIKYLLTLGKLEDLVLDTAPVSAAHLIDICEKLPKLQNIWIADAEVVALLQLQFPARNIHLYQFPEENNPPP